MDVTFAFIVFKLILCTILYFDEMCWSSRACFMPRLMLGSCCGVSCVPECIFIVGNAANKYVASLCGLTLQRSSMIKLLRWAVVLDVVYVSPRQPANEITKG